MVYIIAQCNLEKWGPSLGRLTLAGTYSEAVEIAVALAREQCDTNEVDIREELNNEASFADPNKEWSICIGIP